MIKINNFQAHNDDIQMKSDIWFSIVVRSYIALCCLLHAVMVLEQKNPIGFIQYCFPS